MASTKAQQQKTTCKCCQYQGCDASFIGCGCSFHVRCLPPSVVRTAVRSSAKANDRKAQQDYSQNFSCPYCHQQVTGIYLFPLPFEKLEKAIGIKRKSSSHQTSKATSGSKRKHGSADEVAFSVYSKWRTGGCGMLVDGEQHRTGRWTDSEMAFVDQVVTTFEDGKLAVAEGVKLNTLLCDLLQCKSSRLTKKMKNAKLSTRAFKAASEVPGIVNQQEDCQILSALQEKFLGGRPDEAAQLELQFNVIKQWRSYFSNFCMQAGYMFLDSNDWTSSIEDLERRASAVEEKFRKVRKKSMSKALNSENKRAKITKAAKPKSVPSAPPSSATPPPRSPASATPEEVVTPSSLLSVFAKAEDTDTVDRRPRTFSEDFDNILEDLARGEEEEEDNGMMAMSSLPEVPLSIPVNHPSNDILTPPPTTFLDALCLLLETPTSPYHYADIWVPSFVNNKEEKIQLLNAGYAARRDVDGTTFSSLNAFGEYSKSFTLKPGQGLEASVFSTGKPIWNFNIQEQHFTRASGANNYGLKAAMGIPLNTEGVGRMVVVFFSCNDIVEDKALADRFAQELTKYSPKPKWKLVIDIKSDDHQSKVSAPNNQAFSVSNDDVHTRIEGDLMKTFESSGIVSPSLSSLSNAEHAMPSCPLESCFGDSVDSEIISLLGNEAAKLNAEAFATKSSSQDSKELLPHYMSIRLLFLRAPSRRSSQENERVEVLKCSYRAYMKGSSRSSSDLAKLLVRDWVCMKKTPSRSFSLDGPNTKENAIKPQGISLLRPSEDTKKAFMLQPTPNTLYKSPTTGSMDTSETKTRPFSVTDVLEGCN